MLAAACVVKWVYGRMYCIVKIPMVFCFFCCFLKDVFVKVDLEWQFERVDYIGQIRD